MKIRPARSSSNEKRQFFEKNEEDEENQRRRLHSKGASFDILLQLDPRRDTVAWTFVVHKLHAWQVYIV